MVTFVRGVRRRIVVLVVGIVANDIAAHIQTTTESEEESNVSIDDHHTESTRRRVA